MLISAASEHSPRPSLTKHNPFFSTKPSLFYEYLSCNVDDLCKPVLLPWQQPHILKYTYASRIGNRPSELRSVEI